MGFAFAGDSTTTIFIGPIWWGGYCSTQRDEIARMTVDPPVQFELENERGASGGCQLALAHQFVNRDRCRSEQSQDKVEPGVVRYRLDRTSDRRNRLIFRRNR